jgi:hypothetical protein
MVEREVAKAVQSANAVLQELQVPRVKAEELLRDHENNLRMRGDTFLQRIRDERGAAVSEALQNLREQINELTSPQNLPFAKRLLQTFALPEGATPAEVRGAKKDIEGIVIWLERKKQLEEQQKQFDNIKNKGLQNEEAMKKKLEKEKREHEIDLNNMRQRRQEAENLAEKKFRDAEGNLKEQIRVLKQETKNLKAQQHSDLAGLRRTMEQASNRSEQNLRDDNSRLRRENEALSRRMENELSELRRRLECSQCSRQATHCSSCAASNSVCKLGTCHNSNPTICYSCFERSLRDIQASARRESAQRYGGGGFGGGGGGYMYY